MKTKNFVKFWKVLLYRKNSWFAFSTQQSNRHDYLAHVQTLISKCHNFLQSGILYYKKPNVFSNLSFKSSKT